MEYRINGFDQIKAFYSIVFEQKHEIRPQHISLYVFLINQNNRNNWVEWFKCPYDLAMAGACIGNKKTYYKCLSDLQDWGLIKYEKGINDYKAPKIKIEVLNSTSTDTSTVPQSEPLLQPLPTPLPTPQGTHIYKPITGNKKQKKQEFDFSFVANNFKEAFDLWIEYKIEIKKPYKTQKGIQSAYNELLKFSKGNPKLAMLVIEQSISKEWQGLFEFKGQIEPEDKTDMFFANGEWRKKTPMQNYQ